MELPDELVASILCFLDLSELKAALVTSRRLFSILMSDYMKKYVMQTDYRSKLTKMIHESILQRNISKLYHLLTKGYSFVEELEEKIVVDMPFDEEIVNSKEIMKIRISNDVLIDEPDRPNRHFTSLFYAVSMKDLNILKLLLRCGADPNRRDSDDTPLLHHLLAMDGLENRGDYFSELLKHGAKPDLKNRNGHNSVEYAIINNIPVYRGLIEHSQSIRFDILYDKKLRDLAKKNRVKFEEEEEESTTSKLEFDEFGYLKNESDSQAFPTLNRYLKRMKDRSQTLITEWMSIMSQSKNFIFTEGHGKVLKKTSRVVQLVRMGLPRSLRGIIYPLFFPIDQYKKKNRGMYQYLLNHHQSGREGSCIEMTIPRVTFTMKKFKDEYSEDQGRVFRLSMSYGVFDEDRIGCSGCCGLMELAMILLSYIDDEETVFYILWFIFNGESINLNSRRMKSKKSEDGRPVNEFGFCHFVLEECFREQLPRIYRAMKQFGLEIYVFSYSWLTRLLLRFAPPVIYERIFDIVLCEGYDVIYSFLLAYFKIEEERILSGDVNHVGFIRSMQTAMDGLSCDIDKYFEMALKMRISKREMERYKNRFEMKQKKKEMKNTKRKE